MTRGKVEGRCHTLRVLTTTKLQDIMFQSLIVHDKRAEVLACLINAKSCSLTGHDVSRFIQICSLCPGHHICSCLFNVMLLKALDSGKLQFTTNPKCIDLLTALPKASVTSLLGSLISLKWYLLRRSASHIPFHFARRSRNLTPYTFAAVIIQYSDYCAYCLSIDVDGTASQTWVDFEL